MKRGNLVKLIFSVLVCQLAGIIGSIFTAPSIMTWYATLQKPAFNPPSWVFFPVWTLLFLLMGISLYLVLKKGLNKAKAAVTVFSLQLLLNIAWSFLFFGLHNPFYALIEIAALWLAIAITIKQFYKIDKKAAYLLIPYILWVSFAAMLNFGVWRLNF